MFRTQKKATIVEYINEFNLPADPLGVCLGYSYEAVISILSMQIKTSDTRIQLIFNKSPQELKSSIQKKWDKDKLIIEKVKERVGPFRKLNADELEWLESEAPIEIKQIHEDTQEKEKIDFFLFDLYLQKKIQDEFSYTSDTRKITLTIPDFFKKIVLYQNPEQFLDLFGKDITIFDIKKNIMELSPLLPESIKHQGGVAKIKTIIGAYHLEDLITYLTTLKNSFQKLNLLRPMAFMLRSINHALAIGYIPQSGYLYFINNTRSVPFTLDKENLEELAQNILTSLSKNDVACFSTEVYGCRYNQSEINQVMDMWVTDPAFQKIHFITPKLLNYTDSFQVSLLPIALKMEDVDLTVMALQAGANPNKTFLNGITPLIAATQSCSLQLIQKLIEQKADPNVSLKNGATALWFAAQRGDIEIFKYLYQISNNKNPECILILTSDKEATFNLEDIATFYRHNSIVTFINNTSHSKKMIL